MKAILIFLSLSFANISFAQQADNEAIKAVINRLFEGMKKGDSSMVHSVFHANAIIQTTGISEKTKKFYLITENRLKQFLKVIGSERNRIWDEHATSFDIKIDNQMAQAWVPYEFILGGKFSHCGVDNFTLYKEDKEWKIVYLIDTTRKDNCVK